MPKTVKVLAGLGLLMFITGGLAIITPPSWDPSGITKSCGFLVFMVGIFVGGTSFVLGFGRSTHG